MSGSRPRRNARRGEPACGRGPELAPQRPRRRAAPARSLRRPRPPRSPCAGAPQPRCAASALDARGSGVLFDLQAHVARGAPLGSVLTGSARLEVPLPCVGDAHASAAGLPNAVAQPPAVDFRIVLVDRSLQHLDPPCSSFVEEPHQSQALDLVERLRRVRIGVLLGPLVRSVSSRTSGGARDDPGLSHGSETGTSVTVDPITAERVVASIAGRTGERAAERRGGRTTAGEPRRGAARQRVCAHCSGRQRHRQRATGGASRQLADDHAAGQDDRQRAAARTRHGQPGGERDGRTGPRRRVATGGRGDRTESGSAQVSASGSLLVVRVPRRLHVAPVARGSSHRRPAWPGRALWCPGWVRRRTARHRALRRRRQRWRRRLGQRRGGEEQRDPELGLGQRPIQATKAAAADSARERVDRGREPASGRGPRPGAPRRRALARHRAGVGR